MTVTASTTLGEVERMLACRAERITELEANEQELHERINDLFNPADDYSTEMDAVERAHAFIVEQPCSCTFTGPEKEREFHDDGTGTPLVPWGDEDRCKRCDVLGRYFDKPIGR